MNIDIVVLRLLHIVSGAFWVGAILFTAFILRPRLMSPESGANRRLRQSIDRAVNSSTGIAGLITVAAGIGLALRLRWGHLDTFFNSGWGFAILIGFIAAMCAFVLGAMEARTISAVNGLSEDNPDSVDAAALQSLEGRILVLGRVHALLVLIAVGSMASARFV